MHCPPLRRRSLRPFVLAVHFDVATAERINGAVDCVRQFDGRFVAATANVLTCAWECHPPTALTNADAILIDCARIAKQCALALTAAFDHIRVVIAAGARHYH